MENSNYWFIFVKKLKKMFEQTHSIAEIPAPRLFDARKVQDISTIEYSLPALYLSHRYFKYSTEADAQEVRFFQQLTNLIERDHKKK